MDRDVSGVAAIGRARPEAVKAQLNAAGYAVLHGYGSGRTSDVVAAEFGPVLVPPGWATVQTLMPQAASTPNTYSGLFGLGSFPFHTDLAHWWRPPRYLLLRCVRGYNDLPTLLVDGTALIDAMGGDLTARALLKPRRPQDGEVRLLRLHERHAGGMKLRWDSIFLKPASQIGEAIFSEMQSRLANVVPMPIRMVEDGDVLVIDNWRMLHARPAIPSNRRDRHLERVYLEGIG